MMTCLIIGLMVYFTLGVIVFTLTYVAKRNIPKTIRFYQIFYIGAIYSLIWLPGMLLILYKHHRDKKRLIPTESPDGVDT